MSLTLRIISPERIVFVGEVESVTVPGTMGEFQVLPNHAPLISSLDPGKVVYDTDEGRMEIDISGGFAEVQNNNVSLCVEL
ncbi:MAG: ATP synthase F1 subunit epsilon [Prevotella sp.]